MMTIILKIILFQALFLGIYDLLLRKETFYNANRYFLLGTSLLAIVLPFVAIGLSTNSFIKTKIVALPEIILSPQQSLLPEFANTVTTQLNYMNILYWVYLFGIGLAALFFILKIIKLYHLVHSNKKVVSRNYTLVELPKTSKAFSFLKYVFIGDTINNKDNEYLLTHEQVHIRQKHSYDLLWFEFLKIVLWFNPFVYIYQKRITALHEFIADDESIKNTSKKAYYNHLLNDLFQVENIAFVNQFYHKSLLKKRIIMLTKNKSEQWRKAKYLLVLPMTLLMLFFSLEQHAQEKKIDKNEAWEQLQKFIKEHNLNDFTKEDYLEFQRLSKNVIPDSLYDPIQDKTYVEYLARRKELKSLPKAYADGVPFTIIDEVPIFPGCEDLLDKKERRKCLSDMILEHVVKEFNVALAQNLDLKPGKKRVSVLFSIDRKGNINHVKARAPHPDLEKEAIRVIKALPTMAPGKQDGIAVNVKYALPITFLVEEKKQNKK